MALQKSLSTPFGINATYWKIIDLNINWLSNTSHVALCGWKDKTSRDNGDQPLTSRSFDWSGSEFPFVDEEPQNERATAYTNIKGVTDGEFVDALDV